MQTATTAKGLIIKQTDYGEANRMLTIFTDEYGIIKAAAHGAKRSKGKSSAASQFLTYAEFSLYITSGEIWNINSIDTIDSFFPIQEDIEKLSAASYFTDIAYACLDQHNPDTEILRLLLNTVYAMAYKNVSAELAKPVFELRCTALAGFEPVMGCCTTCGREDELSSFSTEEGGMVCHDCAVSGDLPVYSGAHSMMQYALTADLSKLFSFEVDERIVKQVSYITERYLLRQLDRDFDSLAYYKKIVSGIKNNR